MALNLHYCVNCRNTISVLLLLLAMFKFTLNFLKINWSLRDIFILCKQVSEPKENIVISMSFLTDDFVFSIPLSTAWCSPRYKCNAFINFHNSPFMA